MSEIELLPCPFCGGRPEVIEFTEDDGFENRGGSAIECQRCLASSRVEFGCKENLVSSWNRRAALSSAALEEQLAEALKALDGLLKPFEGDDCRYDHHGYCQAHFLQEAGYERA